MAHFEFLPLSYNPTFRHISGSKVKFQTNVITIFTINLHMAGIFIACILQQIPLFRPLLFHSVKVEADILQLAHQHRLVNLHT